MTPLDKPIFLQAFNRLAVACRLPANEVDEHMKRIYYDGLADFEIAAVELAAENLARTLQWFPKLAEWRQAAGQARVESLVKALPGDRDEEWRDECGACFDTGWEQRTCYPGTLNTCGSTRCSRPRKGDSLKEHHYMIVCTCRPNNRTYARHHQIPASRKEYRA